MTRVHLQTSFELVYKFVTVLSISNIDEETLFSALSQLSVVFNVIGKFMWTQTHNTNIQILQFSHFFQILIVKMTHTEFRVSNQTNYMFVGTDKHMIILLKLEILYLHLPLHCSAKRFR